jgi:hypothetical protein
MTVSYEIYKIKDFIRRTETGEINIQKSLTAVKDLALASEFHKDVNILIDLRETETTLDFEDLLKVILEFGNYKDCFRNKIAVVIPEDPERINRAGFFKVGMKVEGLLFEFFTDYEKAIEWLSEVEPLDDKGRNRLV